MTTTTARQEAESAFPRDISNHVMNVIRDDGLYRHLRFAKPGTMCMHFDIITWPGYLAYVGDMGSYVFRRVFDMFDFFREVVDKPGAPRICPDYWSQKVEAMDKTDGIKEYSEELARAWVKERLDEGEASDEVREEAESIDFNNGEARLYDSIDSVGWHGFADHWEANFKDFTYRYIWCCLAIVWAVKQYDAKRPRPEIYNPGIMSDRR
jgi:hypothetical protein